MHRIDTNSAVDGNFADKNVSLGVEGTVVDASWLNSVQDEICNVVEAAGKTLNKNDDTQLVVSFDTLAKIAIKKNVVVSNSVKETITASRLRVSDKFHLEKGFVVDLSLGVDTMFGDGSGDLVFALYKDGGSLSVESILTVAASSIGRYSTRYIAKMGDSISSGNYYIELDISATAPSLYRFSLNGVVSKN